MGRGQQATNVLYGPTWTRQHAVSQLPEFSELHLEQPGFFEDCLGFSGYRECFARCSSLPRSLKDEGTSNPAMQWRLMQLGLDAEEKILERVQALKGASVERKPASFIPIDIGKEGEIKGGIGGAVVARHRNSEHSYIANVYQARLQAVEALAREPGEWYYDSFYNSLALVSPDQRLLGVANVISL